MLAARDPVVRALGGLAAGATTGAATITIGLLILRTFQRGRVAETQDTGFVILGASVLAGIIAAAGTAWLLSGGIVEAWRRGVTSALSVFAMLLLSLVAVPADLLAGRPGLLAYFVLLVGAGGWSLVQARRAG